MLDLLLAFDLAPQANMRLFFVGVAFLGLVNALEKLARQRWGIVLGVPIATLDEDYPGSIGNPREVDLDPYLYDIGRVEWLTHERLLLSPVNGEVQTSSGRPRTSASRGIMCVGDLQIDAPPESIRFRTRVRLRIVPTLGFLLFIVGAYVPAPWGMGWPLPGGGEDLLGALWPLILFGGFLAYATVQARSGVITAHHAVTGAFMATLRPSETRDPSEPEPGPES
jgi:hypothetical protein